MSLSLAVIIPTYGRKEVLERLLRWLGHQTRLPHEVIISAPDETHVPDVETRFPVRRLYGPPSLTAQRNRALDYALSRFDIIAFLDDDLIPATDYMERVARALEDNPDWAVVMGGIVRDGASTKGISWEEGIAIIREAEAGGEVDMRVFDMVGAQGNNMSMRSSVIGDLRFDERLVLYGWQEDIDFTYQLGRRGRVVSLPSIRSVHLGVKSGRVSGVRFGYSQVANPVYLFRKGTMPGDFAFKLMARTIIANIVRSIRPEFYVDRRGRLRGNLIALGHLLRGRIEPEYILEI